MLVVARLPFLRQYHTRDISLLSFNIVISLLTFLVRACSISAGAYALGKIAQK